MKCTRCGFIGKVEDFTSNNKIRKTCFLCREKAKVYDSRRNKVKRNELRRLNEKRKEVKERRKLESKKYYEKNRAAILERNKAYHKKNVLDRQEYLSNWRKNNKDKVKQYSHNRRARENNAEGKLTAKFINTLMTSHPYCEYCNGTNSLSIEHIVPLSRGGSNLPDNITVSCKSCNSSKGSKLLSEWRK